MDTINGDMLVGICMSSESCGSQNGRTDTVLGLTVVNPANTTLLQLRHKISEQFEILQADYKFMTPRGWPVNPNQEPIISVSNVLDTEAIVRIITEFDKPRVGICTHDGSPIGFVFIKFSCSVSQLREAILTQIEVSYPPIQDSNFVFLDRNFWPLSKDQENHLTVLDILNGAVVNIRIRERLGSDDTVLISDITDSPISSPPTKKFKRSSPLSHSSGQSCSPSKMVKFKENDEVVDLGGAKILDSPVVKTRQVAKQMLISYVRQEAAHHALALKSALESMHFSVYLDVHEITCGADWQDALNYAVSDCEVFVPLVTPRYGKTQWTNREVKLADVLGKIIVPVSFLQKWPPQCLAIQFATTQYVRWKTREEIRIAEEGGEGEKATDIKYWEQKYVERVAKAIGEFCKAEFDKLKFYGPVRGLSRKQSMLKSYAASLPEGANEFASVRLDREGKPLVVISVHPDQKECASRLKIKFELDGYEVWCSTDMQSAVDKDADRSFKFEALPRSASDDYSGPSLSQLSHSSNDSNTMDERSIFQEKADEAGVVVFILSKAFAKSQTCQQQVFYCEHRKRVVPLKYEDFEMPGWMSMLIGTSTFEDAKRDGYTDSLLSLVKQALDPKARENCSDEINEAKVNVHINFIKRSLPEYHNVVYISGGTKFFWAKSEAICNAIGKSLSQDDNIILVTGGFYGVGETVAKSFLETRRALKKPDENVWHILPVKDEQDRRLQARQNQDRTFQSVPFGQTLFSGENVRQRESVVARVFDICILVEGGPGAAHEAEEFAWNDHTVIPIKCTGGAAGGKFNVPSKIYEVPNGVKVEDWQLLGNQGADPCVIGEAVRKVVFALQNSPAKRLTHNSIPPGSPRRRLIPRMTIIPPPSSPPAMLSQMKTKTLASPI
ncbi:uncharacterized protein LOC144446494 isoform X2 [Glandiceps talaboti]